MPARYNLGVVHRDLENWEAAWILFIDVIAHDRNAAAAYNNLAIVEEHFGLYQAAETHYRQAIALKNQFPDAHFNLGMLCCDSGRWREGFAECECAVADQPVHSLSGPSSRLERRTVTRHSAGPQRTGGRRCHPVRAFSSSAAERCDRILFVCPERLHRLFELPCPASTEIRGPGPLQYSDFAAYIPLLSLPRALGTTLESVPCRYPYLPLGRSVA